MSESAKKKTALERVASVLEAAQFNNGSLDLTIQGAEGFAEPLKVRVSLHGEDLKSLSAELSGVAAALQNIADAIRETKK